jgi:hypothetical protein
VRELVSRVSNSTSRLNISHHQPSRHSTEIAFFGCDLEVSIDDRHSQQNTRATAQCPHHITRHRQSANTSTSKCGSRGNNTLEFLVHALLTVPGHNESLILELFGDIARCGARDFDPGLAEEGTCDDDEGDVDDRVNGVEEGFFDVVGRGHIVCDSTGGVKLRRSFTGLPGADELDEEVVGEAGIEHLGNHEDVGCQRGLQHDGHVGGVEESDRVGAAHATLSGGFYGDFDAEALQVDDGREDCKGGKQVHDVGQVLAVEGLAKRAKLVGPGDEEMEEGDDGAFEFFAAAGVDGGGREGLPDDRLADIGGNEERDTRAQTVAFLQKLIEENDDKASKDKLHNEEETDARAEIAGLTVQASEDEHASLAEGEDNREELLSRLV